MKYWVIIDNRQHGPLTIEELAAWGRLRRNTPVWHEGLPSWVDAADVEAFAVLLTPPVPGAPAMPSGVNGYDPYHRAAFFVPEAPKDTFKPEPKTYLVWAILTTILCCIPTGIVAIWMSTRVTRRYEQGDYDGADSASQAAALWVIVSITLGMISIPFQMVMAML
jgi:hypothetical protein